MLHQTTATDREGARDVLPPGRTAIRLALMYQASKAIHFAVEAGIPDIMKAGRRNSAEIADAIQSHPEAVYRLLRALAAFDIVVDCGNRNFQLTAVGNTLCTNSPDSVRSLILMFGSEHAWEMFASFPECILTGQNAFQIRYGVANSFAYLETRPDLARLFDEGMTAASLYTGPAIAKAYDFGRVGHIVDVGGGQGKLLVHLLHAYPNLRGTLFDLPRVAHCASSYFEHAGLSARCTALAGDMFHEVPEGGDVYLLSHVAHDWDDRHALRILESCRRATRPSAQLIILDRVMPEVITPDATVHGNVLLDLTMLVRTRGGRERTAAEFSILLERAGLALRDIIALDTPDSLLVAEPQ